MGRGRGYIKSKEMGFDIREVFGEVCVFCGKGSECFFGKLFSWINVVV